MHVGLASLDKTRHTLTASRSRTHHRSPPHFGPRYKDRMDPTHVVLPSSEACLRALLSFHPTIAVLDPSVSCPCRIGRALPRQWSFCSSGSGPGPKMSQKPHCSILVVLASCSRKARSLFLQTLPVSSTCPSRSKKQVCFTFPMPSSLRMRIPTYAKRPVRTLCS